MKNLIAVIAVIIIVVFNALPATASGYEYVVVKDHDKITIYSITLSTSDDNGNGDWVAGYNLTNPTISQLNDSGLPETYWGWTNGKNGIFDTRLEKAKQDLDEMKANYENEVENNDILRETANLQKFYFTLLALVALISVFLFFRAEQRIKNLKRNQK